MYNVMNGQLFITVMHQSHFTIYSLQKCFIMKWGGYQL